MKVKVLPLIDNQRLRMKAQNIMGFLVKKKIKAQVDIDGTVIERANRNILNGDVNIIVTEKNVYIMDYKGILVTLKATRLLPEYINNFGGYRSGLKSILGDKYNEERSLM